MIEAVLKPFDEDPDVEGTLLAVPIPDEETFLNPDMVKLVHDLKGGYLVYLACAHSLYQEIFT